MHDLSYSIYPQIKNFKPKTLIVLLHGYGSNSQDLISLAPDFAPYLEDSLFVSPNAPFQFEGGGFNAYQWYSLLDRSNQSMLAGFEKAKPILHNFLHTLLQKYSLSFNDLILAGFSQGGMMSLQYGIQSKDKLKGLISFSGYLVEDEALDRRALSYTPILLTHGDMDNVVPLVAYKKSLAKLKSLNFTVAGHVSQGLAHGIDYTCLEAAQNFIKNL